MDVIGVDMREDHALARRVHSYRRASDPASFTRAVREVFAEVSEKGDDSVQAGDFALLAGLPADMAVPMILGLAGTGNHPIGETAGKSTHEHAVTEPEKASSKQQAMQRPTQLTPQGESGNGFFLVLVSVMLVGFVISVLRRKN